MPASTSRSNAARGPVEVVGVERRSPRRARGRRGGRRAARWRGARRARSPPRRRRRRAARRTSAGDRGHDADARRRPVACAGSSIGESQPTGCAFTQRIAASSSCSGRSCGSTPRPPRRASVAARRGPVTEFMFADTIGIVAPVPSVGRQIHREPARDAGSTRHEEHVGVGEVVGRDLSREAHASTLRALKPQVCWNVRRGVRIRRPMRVKLVDGVTRGDHPDPWHRRIVESGRSAVSNPVTGVTPEDGTSGEFGANEWLVDEMYERYLVDKDSVDRSWWPILESYRPVDDPTPTQVIPVVTAEAPAAPAEAPAAPAEAPRRRRRRRRGRRRGAEGAGRRRGPDPRGRHRAAAPAVAPAPASDPAPSTTPIARTTSAPAKPQPIPAEAPTTASIPVVERASREETVHGAQGHVEDARHQHGREPHGADRDERAHHPGEADDRQPHRHQQPPAARPRRQGVVHAPHRLGDGADAQGVPEPERLLRRGRRQARASSPPRTSTSASRSTSRSPTAPVRCSCPASSAPTR